MAAAGFLPLTGTAANIESSGSYVASYDPDPDPDPDSGSDQPEDLHRHMELYLIIGHQDYSDVRQAKISLKRVKDYWTFDAEKLNSLIDSGWEGYSFIGPYLGFYAQVEGSDLKPELPTAYVIGHESAGFSQINGSFGTSHINAEEVHVNSGKTLGNFCKFDVGKRVQLSRAFLS